MPPKLARKSARRKQQTRLTFDLDLRSSSPATVVSPVSGGYYLPNQRSTPSSRRSIHTVDDGEDSDDPLSSSKKSNMARPAKSKRKAMADGKLPFKALPTPVKSSQTMARGNSLISPYLTMPKHSEDEIESNKIRPQHQNSTKYPPYPIGASSSKSRSRSVVDLDESDGSPPEDEVDTSSKKKKGKQREDLSSDTDDRFPTPKSSQKRKAALQIEEDSDDEDIPTSTIRRHTRVVPLAEESDEEPITSPLKKRGRHALTESDDSDIHSSPWKRRKQVGEYEEADDSSDLPSVQDIQSSRRARSRSRLNSNASPILNRITRQAKGRKHRTEREKKMELLKRKRAGEDIDELTDSTEDSSEPKRGVYDTDSDLEILSDFEDEERESEPEIVQKLKKKSNVNSYHLSDDSDFVVEDDEDPLGVPLGLLDIPLKFRHAAHKPMKEHFKDAIEWMVHRKINPAFSRSDEMYLQAFSKLDDEYQGYAKSKFVSSQWTAEFTRAIYARPILIERPCGPGEGYTIDGLPKCDVCNHRKHIPKFAIHFEGKAYHKSTLEEVERQDEEDEDSDSDDTLSVNSNGHSLPAEDKEWFSGIVCRDNAQQAHALIHWKYALNEWVIDQLENEGYLTPDKLAEREKMKAKKRRDYANELVDGWEATGILKTLYRDFKGQLEAARESKQGRWEKAWGFVGGD